MFRKSQKRIPCVVIIKDSVVDTIIQCDDEKELERVFLDTLKSNLSNFDEYDQEDIDTIVENGYEEMPGVNGSICMHWVMPQDEDECDSSDTCPNPKVNHTSGFDTFLDDSAHSLANDWAYRGGRELTFDEKCQLNDWLTGFFADKRQ